MLKDAPPADIVEWLSYDPDTGLLSWQRSLPKMRAHVGDIAGSKNRSGYVSVMFRKQRYMAHRLAWLFVTGDWPESFIDHVNGDRCDNRFANLRLATGSENQVNRRTVGKYLRGVKKDARRIRNPYVATICMNKTPMHLGCFGTEEEAHAPYRAAAVKLHGQFARFE